MKRSWRTPLVLAIVAGSMPAYAAGSAEQTCQGAKSQAAGKYAACRQTAEKGFVLKGDTAKHADALAKCSYKLTQAWQKADQKAADAGATCPDAPLEMADVQDAIDVHTDNIATALGGGGLGDCDAELATCGTDSDICADVVATCGGGTATPADVLTGKTFAASGQMSQVGTMVDRGAPTIHPSAAPVPVAAGYYSGGQVGGDTDLVPTNIAAGVDVFGVTGTAMIAVGNATASEVLSGVTFSNGSATGVVGTMTNVGTQNVMPGASPVSLVQGYHDGSGSVAGDADLIAGNILQGAQIFGVSGSLVAASGNATAGDVLTGKTFSNDGGSAAGAMVDNGAVHLTPTTVDQPIAAGHHDGSGTCAGDADLTAGNVTNGTQLFSVVGTARPAQVFKSGEMLCYDTGHASIPCSGTGQDGEFEKGVTRQYLDNGDGSITDLKTGLMWEKLLTSGGGIHDAYGGAQNTFSGALARIATLNSMAFAGHTDWRLPNVNELYGLVAYPDGSSPTVAPEFNHCCGDLLTCSCTRSMYHWTSTIDANSPSRVILVEFSSGFMLTASRTTVLPNRAVRGGV